MLSPRSIFILLFTSCALLLSACSNSKHLAEGESLFIGNRIKIRNFEGTKQERKILMQDLTGLVRPHPNRKAMGIRFKLSFYNLAGKPKKSKGLRKILREKAGEPPVTGSMVRTATNVALAENYLQNRGYFNATAEAILAVSKKKRSTLTMTVNTGQQYTIRDVSFKYDSSVIAKDIDSGFSETLLKKGSPYNLSVAKAERTRIDIALKEKGYFYFKPDYILIVADTGVGDNKIDIKVQLKHKEIPPEAYTRYKINDIFIYADYRLQGTANDTDNSEKVKQDNYYIIDPHKKFNPELFAQSMVFEPHDLYSLGDQNASLSRLVNMGTFKFVKNRFAAINDSLLDVYYYLTPYPKKSFRFELGALTQNDNRAGTRGSISWKNRNTFKGAEELQFKINGGFEAQYTGEQKKPNIYNLGTEMNLSFPRFVVPFINIQTQSRYLPRTLVKLKYRYEYESGLLRINSYTGSYGYDWKQGGHKEHQLFPFNLTYVNTDTLGKISNIRYGNLIFDGIIVGPTYEFTYSSQSANARKHAFYFDGLIDLSGNLLGLSQKADYKTNQRILFGSVYAQYLKLQPDFRYYLRLTDRTNIATRIMAGIGIPYGNSAQLPNIKQFWAGGNSDLRGFQSRLAGPGSFNTDTTKFIETLGDIKLEGNIELRRNIYKFLNAAVFADAGNIWLYRENKNFPGGKFSTSFLKELAVDMGIGLRFDFSILVLRLDLGMPVRKPWLAEEDRWVFNKIAFNDKEWRRQNLILNIAIGYPF